MQPVILLLSVDTYETASQLAETLMSSKLAAQVEVNEVLSFESGPVKNYRLSIVSEWDLYPHLEWTVRKLVEDPKLATLPLMEISTEYKNWIKEKLA